MEKQRVQLVIPTLDELEFRQKLLSDEKTMDYNQKWGGTLPFPKEKWESWYRRWIEPSEGTRFYRYLCYEGRFVGEIAYYFDEEQQRTMANIIVMAEERGKGIGTFGLQALCEQAKKHGIECLYDDIAMDNPSIQLFLNNGFHEEARTKASILVKKVL